MVNLAVSDIMIAVFVTPQHILKNTFTHPGGDVGFALCKLLTGGNIVWVGAASSSVTLVAIAVERFVTVMCPPNTTGKLTKQKLKVSEQKPWFYFSFLN